MFCILSYHIYVCLYALYVHLARGGVKASVFRVSVRASEIVCVNWYAFHVVGWGVHWYTCTHAYGS